MQIGEWYFIEYTLMGQNLHIFAPLFKEREATYIFNISQNPVHLLAPFSVRKNTITKIHTEEEYAIRNNI